MKCRSNICIAYLSFVTLLFLGVQASSVFAECRAILINGGYSASANYTIHAEQIGAMYEALIEKGCKPENIVVLSASGDRDAKEFQPRLWETNNTSYVKGNYKFFKGPPENFRSARKDSIEKAIAETGARARPGDTIFVYLADHGSRGIGVNTWDSGQLGPPEMERYLSKIPESNRVKLWTECCYCGKFNRISRPNSCVATSTDENHMGDYFFSWTAVLNFFDKDIHALKNRFAEVIASGSDGKIASLVSAAKEAQLTSDNSSFREDAKENGDPIVGPLKCRVGPQNSAEEYQFQVLGIKNRSVCTDDLPKLLARWFPSSSPESSCKKNTESVDMMLDQFQSIVQAVGKSALSGTRDEFEKILQEFQQMQSRVKNSAEYENLEELDREFAKMPLPEQLKRARDFQLRAEELRSKLLSAVRGPLGIRTYKNWQALLRIAFNAKATGEERKEYERRVACLEEPLF